MAAKIPQTQPTAKTTATKASEIGGFSVLQYTKSPTGKITGVTAREPTLLERLAIQLKNIFQNVFTTRGTATAYTPLPTTIKSSGTPPPPPPTTTKSSGGGGTFTIPSQYLPTQLLLPFLRQFIPPVGGITGATVAKTTTGTPESTKKKKEPSLQTKELSTELAKTSKTTTAKSTAETGGITIEETIPSSVVEGQSVPPLIQDIQNILREKQVQAEQQAGQVITNVPRGAQTYVYKDPLGGSTPVFEYVISPGENLTKIASRFGTSVEEILRLNKDRKDAIKDAAGNIIIAGRSIRIPVIEKTLPTTTITEKTPQTTEDINKQARDKLQQQPQELTPDDWIKLIQQNFADNIKRIEDIYNNYAKLSDPNYYRNQYESLMNQLGIPDTLAQLRNIENIMASTRDDIMREAAAAGGLVTQSQVEEILNFRQGILKQQYRVLSDLLDEKERMLDKLMTYTHWDRQELDRMLDRELKLSEFEMTWQQKILDREWEIQKYVWDNNYKRIENYAKMGVLHTTSADYLAKLVDPTSPLYTGLSPDDLYALLIYSKQIADERALKDAHLRQSMAIALQNLNLRRESLKLQREKFEWEKTHTKGVLSDENLDALVGE